MFGWTGVGMRLRRSWLVRCGHIHWIHFLRPCSRLRIGHFVMQRGVIRRCHGVSGIQSGHVLESGGSLRHIRFQLMRSSCLIIHFRVSRGGVLIINVRCSNFNFNPGEAVLGLLIFESVAMVIWSIFFE